MKFKREKQLLDKIKKFVDQRSSDQNVAVFDADGTLWFEDTNQILLNYQLKRDREKFKELLTDDYQCLNRDKLCEEFAKKQAGLSLSEFQEQAQASLKQSPLNIFPFQKKLLLYLKKQGMKIVIVTASIQYLVELAVKFYNLPIDQVLGFQTKKDKNNKLSDIVLKPSPTLQSKEEVFLLHYKKKSCFLAAGNTLTDRPLLELAQLAVVVHSAQETDVVFLAEQKLKELSLQKNWILFERIK
ncbi:MAG: haloacid dehalogenase-like hydrolase [Bdellovibrionales bacterium]|nr:haloacid dehalogenase-like hydrolase [Bdellovibrionales bacterium]